MTLDDEITPLQARIGSEFDALARRDPAAAQWLREAQQGLSDAADLDARLARLRLAFARAARQVPPPLLDAARWLLLAAALQGSDPEHHANIVGTLLRRGELGEQCSVARLLPRLPDPERFVDIAVDACRTNAVDLFVAVACENPYPAEHFAPASFNQLVLKAVFLGVDVGRIEGLATRVTPELVRMADDYAAERRAAGREVPSSIEVIRSLLESRP